MKKIYLLLLAGLINTIAFSQSDLTKKTFVIPPAIHNGADLNKESVLNYSQLIPVKEGDEFTITPFVEMPSKKNNLVKGVAKFLGAGLLTYELSNTFSQKSSGSKEIRNTSPSVLPSVGLGLLAAAPDLINAAKGEAKPYIKYSFYNSKKQLVETGVVKQTRKKFFAQATAKQAGYLEVSVVGTGEMIAGNLELAVENKLTKNAIADLPTSSAEGMTFGGEEFNGGGAESSAAWEMLLYIDQYGLDGIPEGDYYFNEDGTVTFTDEYGSVTMDADYFIGSLWDLFSDLYTSISAYANEENTPVVIINEDNVHYSYFASMQALAYNVIQEGLSCVQTNMSYIANSFGAAISPSFYISYWENTHGGASVVNNGTTFVGPGSFMNYVEHFFNATHQQSGMYEAYQIVNAIDAGNMLLCSISMNGFNHEITISGYNGENGNFYYYDSMYGELREISYEDLESMMTHQYNEYFQAIISGVKTSPGG